MLVLAAFLSLLIGLTLGLLGGGGSMLTVPMLVFVVGLDPKEAIASSLFVVGITSFVAAIPHARAGRVRPREGSLFAAAGVPGAFLGGRLARELSASTLLAAFAVVMVLTASSMLRGRPDAPPGGRRARSPWVLLALGALVGTISGLVGAGGGFLIVPALTLVGGLAIAEAIGTSLLVIAVQCLAGFVSHAGHTPLHADLLLLVTSASVIGSLVGARLSRHLPAATLRRGFGVLVLAMGVLVLGKQLPQGMARVVGASALVVVAGALAFAGAASARRIGTRKP